MRDRLWLPLTAELWKGSKPEKAKGSPLYNFLCISFNHKSRNPSLLTSPDISWHLLTSPDISWRFPTSPDIWHLLISPDISLHHLTPSDIFWHLLTSPGISWHLLASPGIFWHLLTSSDIGHLPKASYHALRVRLAFLTSFDYSNCKSRPGKKNLNWINCQLNNYFADEILVTTIIWCKLIGLRILILLISPSQWYQNEQEIMISVLNIVLLHLPIIIFYFQVLRIISLTISHWSKALAPFLVCVV